MLRYDRINIKPSNLWTQLSDTHKQQLRKRKHFLTSMAGNDMFCSTVEAKRIMVRHAKKRKSLLKELPPVSLPIPYDAEASFMAFPEGTSPSALLYLGGFCKSATSEAFSKKSLFTIAHIIGCNAVSHVRMRLTLCMNMFVAHLHKPVEQTQHGQIREIHRKLRQHLLALRQNFTLSMRLIWLVFTPELRLQRVSRHVYKIHNSQSESRWEMLNSLSKADSKQWIITVRSNFQYER